MNLRLFPLLVIAGMNIFTFFFYTLDKKLAVSGKRRISEKNLLMSAFAGGAFGAHAAMGIMRHKTQHIKFLVLIPLAELLWIFLIYLYISRIFLKL